jgi:hypothetical protein
VDASRIASSETAATAGNLAEVIAPMAALEMAHRFR